MGSSSIFLSSVCLLKSHARLCTSSDEMQVNKGDHFKSLIYIVKSGEVKLHDIGHGHSKFDDQILKEGECFGIRSYFESDAQGRAANVTAKTKTSLLTLSMVSTIPTLAFVCVTEDCSEDRACSYMSLFGCHRIYLNKTLAQSKN